jgi:WD40 repeat protein
MLNAAESPEPAAVALCGPGGFGKTTLATQCCRDPRIQEAFPQVLWVETGEDCTPARLVELISDLCVHLDGARPALTDPEQAGFHLARVLGDRPVLLAVDNVWSAADLAPFLLGGSRCVRLITTRNVRVCPSATRILRLGPMSPHEITELLRRSVSALPRGEAARLAELCGGWPLLASIVSSNVSHDVAAGAPLERAAANAGDSLRLYGPQAFDVWDADQRHSAIGHAIMASLRSLDEHVVISGGDGLRERYLSLAVFPAAVPVPIGVLAQWWGATWEWTRTAVRQFCRILADRSLISAYLADRDAIVVHDVFRAYLRNEVGADWASLHSSLIEAHRPASATHWADLGTEDPYMWRYLAYHLHEAGLDEELVAVLASPQYIVNKVTLVGYQALAADAEALALSATTSEPAATSSARPVAAAMTSAGYLLRDLTRQSDLATTLLVALLRTADDATAVGDLHEMTTRTGSPFAVMWARRSSDPDAPVGHVGAVVSVSVIDDVIASGGEDGVVRLWNRGRGELLHECRGHTGWVYATAISPDGEMLATAGEDAVIRLWRVQDGRPIGLMLGHTRRIRALAFADSASVLVSGAEDGHVYVWDSHARSLLRAMETNGCPVWSVAVGCGGSVVAIGGEDEFVRLFDLESGCLLDEAAGHRDWVRSVAFAGSAPLLASASGDRSVRIWGVSDKRLSTIRRHETPRARPRSVVMSDRGDLVLVGDEDARLQAFTSEGLVSERKMPSGVDWIRSLARPGGDGALVIGCEDGGVRTWHPGQNEQLRSVAAGANTVWSTVFAEEGRHAVLGYGDGTIEVCDAGSAEILRRYPTGRGRVWSAAAGGGRIAAACGDGTVFVTALDTDEVLLLNTDVPRTWAVAIDASGKMCATATGDGHIRMFDLPTGRLLWQKDAHAGRVRSLAFDATATRLVACGGSGAVSTWDTGTAEVIDTFDNPAGWARSVTLDPTGTHITVGSGTGDIYVRDTPNNRFQAQLSGHAGRILMVGYAEDPDILSSASADGTARIWSVSRQAQIAETRVDASLHCAAWDRSTGQLLTASAEGLALLCYRNSARSNKESRR